MTSNQIIALFFPVGTVAAVTLLAYGLKLWLDRKYPVQARTATRPLRPDEADAVREAREAIADAERVIHRAGQRLVEH